MPSDGVSLVLQVTPARPQVDRETGRRRCYAGAQIPAYLLDPVPLPEPFAFDLDTGDFL